MTAIAYLIRTLQFILIAAIAVVGINYTVDPYGVFGSPRVPGLNEYKVDISNYVRLSKKYNPLRVQHNALIVGNSRVEIGISPAQHCFHNAGMKVYNLGVPGASVQTQLAYALNIIHQQPVNTVFLSLDYTDFTWTRKRNRFDYQPLFENTSGEFRYTASGKDNPAFTSVLMLDYYQSLFSLDSLVSSLKTVAMQDSAASDRDDTGFNPARDFEEAVRIEGPSALFDQKMSDLRDHFSIPWYLRDEEGRLDPSFDDLKFFLDFAVNRNIKVYLFINPFHEIYWELLRKRGQMRLNVEWLNAVEAMVQKYPDDSVSLWDFSGDSPFTQEAVPVQGEMSGPLQWFWEPSHYRVQLGDLMIEAMLSDSCNTDVAFGRRVH